MACLTQIICVRQDTVKLPRKEEEGEYIPSLYLSSPWVPPRAGDAVEQGIKSFENEIDKQPEVITPSRQTHLNYYQLRAMKELHLQEDIHVCDSNKNPGPTAGNTTSYKSRICDEHLNTEACTEFIEGEANKRNAETKRLIKKKFHKKYGLSKAS
jgi:hypothetical protein